MGDMDWGALAGLAAKLINSGMSAADAQKMAMDALNKAQGNIGQARADYDAVGTPHYDNVVAEQLGPTALNGIQNDPAGRAAEQQAIAKLQELADNGGLSLADMAALNQIQGNLNRNVQSNRKSLENQFAARGQLGGGAQLGMELAGNQNAAQNANQAGESAAGQAQARAMQAIMQKGNMGRQMSQDDYAKKSEAAKATDLINQRNAAARTAATMANNSFAGQGFDDRMAVAHGKSSLLAPTLDNAYRVGNQQSSYRAAQADQVNNAIDGATKAWDAMSKDNSSNKTATNDNGDGFNSDDEINEGDD